MEITLPYYTVVFESADVQVVCYPNGQRAVRQKKWEADSLVCWNKNLDFLSDKKFMAAYRAGMSTEHKIMRTPGTKDDNLHIEWRAHTICWAARHGLLLEGDFVECGVNTGIYALAICQYLDFQKYGKKKFYLFDTYNGLPVEDISPHEQSIGRKEQGESYYEECYEVTKKVFAPYPNVQLVRGHVPETLDTVPIEKVAYLSIDMNLMAPEIASINFFWDKLVPGAMVVLDDYAWLGHEQQKLAMDAFAASKGSSVLTLPTGQGLICKP